MSFEPEPEQTIWTFLDAPIRFTGGRVDGSVVSRIADLDVDLARQEVDGRWWADEVLVPDLIAGEVDHRWRWETLIETFRSGPRGPYVRPYAITTDDGRVQAAAILRLDHHSFLEKNEDGRWAPAVYVDRLASAPWNRHWVTRDKLAEVVRPASALLDLAVALSHFLSFGGRFVLESVDRERTIASYKRYGLCYTGVKHDEQAGKYYLDPDDRLRDRLAVMELPGDVARIKLSAMRFR